MTNDRDIGAVCSLAGVKYAISAARVVLEKTPHTLVSGPHAINLVEESGIETDIDLWTEHSQHYRDKNQLSDNNDVLDQLNHVRPTYDLSEFSEQDTEHERTRSDHDTVGAVAHGKDQFACATSTGGRWSALAGRVGDVPQASSGFYCNPAGGASVTGSGEDISRVTLARRAVQHLEEGYEPQEAADLAINQFSEMIGGTAGIILLDANNAGSVFNSDAMQTVIKCA